MRQAWHIFQKDVHQLWPEVGLTLLGFGVFCVMGVENVRGPGVVAFILPMIWWFLIARVIHLEPVPGKAHYWLTRPYSRRSLVAAKLLFALVFVSLPLGMVDAIVLGFQGFSLAEAIAGIAWKQVLFWAAFILPAAAISAITSGLIEFLIVSLLFVLAFLLWAVVDGNLLQGAYWMELEWVRSYFLAGCVAAASAGTLFWQYARRKTMATRLSLLAGAGLICLAAAMLPWKAAFALQSKFSIPFDTSPMNIELDAQRSWLARSYAASNGQIATDLPLRISGLPPDLEVRPLGLKLLVQFRDGSSMNVDGAPADLFDFQSGVLSLRTLLNKSEFLKRRDQRIQIKGTLYFTLLGRKRSAELPVAGQSVRIAGVGFCSAEVAFVTCKSALRGPQRLGRLRIHQDSPSGPKINDEVFPSLPSYSPFPADFRISPLDIYFSERISAPLQVQIETLEPLAFLHRDFEIDGIKLSTFQSPTL